MDRYITQQLSEKYDYLAPDGSEIRLLPSMKGGGASPLYPANRQHFAGG